MRLLVEAAKRDLDKGDRRKRFRWGKGDVTIDKTPQRDRKDRFRWKGDEIVRSEKPVNEEAAPGPKLISRVEDLQKTKGSDHEDEFAKHAKSFSKDHLKHIGMYKNNSAINDFLRSNSTLYESDRDHVKHLDHVTSHVLRKPMTVFRGFEDYGPKIHALKVGDEFHDKAFVSTSMNPHTVAKEFAEPKIVQSGRGKSARFEAHFHIAQIHVPAGMRGYHIDRHQNTSKYHKNGEEEEVLLPRNTRFRVMGHSHYQTEDHDHYHIVHLEVIGHGEDK